MNDQNEARTKARAENKNFHNANKWRNIEHLAMPLWAALRRINASKENK